MRVPGWLLGGVAAGWCRRLIRELLPVERISDHRPGAEAGEPVSACVAADQAENLVVVGDELAGDRHADRADRAASRTFMTYSRGYAR